uniref:Uncharacterized protein n=1 Tax=Vespula pensylvanica TaxID=30213 RepID=A0A834P5F7_VESPE|nr:hypothetical protein H0235_007310 [Vespula pensylvanica]
MLLVRECSIAIVKARSKEEAYMPKRLPQYCGSRGQLSTTSHFFKDFKKGLKNAAICSEILAGYEISIHHKYCRPTSHRVEVAAFGDPRTNGGSTLYYFYYYEESEATGRPPLSTNSSLQMLKLQSHAFPHLGTDLRIAQLSNIESFDHHLSTTDCASRLTPEPKIESSRTHRYLREYSGNTHANMLST